MMDEAEECKLKRISTNSSGVRHGKTLGSPVA